MRQAKTGDTVRVHYTGTLADGTEFESSVQREPIEITIGDGQVFPGFEEALVGMAEADTKTVTLEAENACGPRIPELVHSVERTLIPAEIDLQIGTELQATGPDGNHMRVVVIALSDDSVTLDANHPLAGEALTFNLQLVGFVG